MKYDKSSSQKSIVASHINAFRNSVTSVREIREEKKLDKFCSCKKPVVCLEILMPGSENVDNAAPVALNVDSALDGAGMVSYGHGTTF